jgi:hypothetical protein
MPLWKGCVAKRTNFKLQGPSIRFPFIWVTRARRGIFRLCVFPPHLQRDGRGGTRPRCRQEATTKLQKTGRRFLVRLVAEYGRRGAARILRRLADEIETLWRIPDPVPYHPI